MGDGEPGDGSDPRGESTTLRCLPLTAPAGEGLGREAPGRDRVSPPPSGVCRPMGLDNILLKASKGGILWGFFCFCLFCFFAIQSAGRGWLETSLSVTALHIENSLSWRDKCLMV